MAKKQKTIAELAQELIDAKQIENEANIRRVSIEEAIADLVNTPDVGSKTVEAGSRYKVTVKRGIIYKANVAGIRGVVVKEGEKLPVTFVPPSPSTYTFDEKAYEELRTSNPALFAVLAEFVESKPRKVSVTVALA